jgi:peptidoglycan-associated lipoprotein
MEGEKRKMTSKKVLWTGLAVMVLLLSVAFLTGCAKKATLKEEAVVTQEQKPVSQAPVTVATDDQAARERALRDQALRDQALRDQAARDAAARAAKDAADKAKRDAATKAAAILKELQIPDVNFDFDKYNLKPDAQAILKAGTPAYLKYREYKLIVEGHCDERGTAEYNLALGQKRADVTAKYLTDLGIDKERIKTISYGKEMPLDKGHDEAAWAKNRRVHFVVVAPTKN